MTFQPRMQSKIDQVTVVGNLAWKAWTSVVADVWTVDCAPGAAGEYVSPDPRLFFVLDTGGPGHIALGEGARVLARPAVGTISFIPAAMPIWSRLEDLHRLRHLDIHFDATRLSSLFEASIREDQFARPVFSAEDPRILNLARLIAEECASGTGLHDLYGESLSLALLTVTLNIEQPTRLAEPSLAPRVLKRVTDFIAANCARNIRLEELAALTGLSQSYFCRAFKASTGLPPHQWQMRAKIDRAKSLLETRKAPLTEIAAAAGFADQAHFTRVFRRVVGETPAAWQRSRAR